MRMAGREPSELPTRTEQAVYGHDMARQAHTSADIARQTQLNLHILLQVLNLLSQETPMCELLATGGPTELALQTKWDQLPSPN